MTCTPQLKSTGIFRPKIKLQNNKQKVKLSNSGSGGANPKERPVKAKGSEKLHMWLSKYSNFFNKQKFLSLDAQQSANNASSEEV